MTTFPQNCLNQSRENSFLIYDSKQHAYGHVLLYHENLTSPVYPQYWKDFARCGPAKAHVWKIGSRASWLYFCTIRPFLISILFWKPVSKTRFRGVSFRFLIAFTRKLAAPKIVPQNIDVHKITKVGVTPKLWMAITSKVPPTTLKLELSRNFGFLPKSHSASNVPKHSQVQKMTS